MFVLMFSIVLALIIVIFAVQNAAAVPVQFIIWSAHLPLVLIIFCSVFAGALLMFCLAVSRELKNQIKKRSKNQTEIKKGAGPKAAEADPIDVSNAKNTDDLTCTEKTNSNVE